MATSPESCEQRALFAWADLKAGEPVGRGGLPELAFMYAVPNGGERGAREAGRLVAEGVRAGVPDVALDVARGGWHGLRLEMKAPGPGKASARLRPEQRLYAEHLDAEGYAFGTFSDWRTAADFVEEYARGRHVRVHGYLSPSTSSCGEADPAVAARVQLARRYLDRAVARGVARRTAKATAAAKSTAAEPDAKAPRPRGWAGRGFGR